MKRLPPLLLLLAVLCCGCATRGMKGTPFYTGEYKTREGPASDRVNLWPIAYYRNPALSVLWPIGEFSDDRFAIRPIFSMYRDGEGEPWHEFNWLGGLVSFDTESHRHMAFPAFWGPDYFNVFPLYWSGSDPRSGDNHNALFPLWIWSRDGDETMLFCPWPLVARFTGPRENRFAVFPLWDHRRDPSDPGRYSDRFGLFLAGNLRDGASHTHWAVPFYYAKDEAGTGGDRFVSLPWAAMGDDWRAIPLLLSAWSPDGERGRVLLGLGGWEGPERWAFPLFYHNAETGELVAPLCYRNPHTGVFLSPLWASKEGAWRCIPPLLSWWSPKDGSGRALLGLAGWDDARSWAIPLYYRDAASDTLVTPLWAHQGARWSAVPPLLSWRSLDPATGESSLYLLGGLAGATPKAHWFAPLYFRDEENDRFYSLLYASGRDWRAIPPLLSWWNADGSGRALLGLAGWDGDGNRHWLFPLYYRDAENGRFVSLLYAQGRKWRGIPPLLTAWSDRGDFVSPLYAQTADGCLVPPLLSWWNQDGGRALLGLGGWEPDKSWLFPLWYRDDESFLTPLAGRFGDGTRYWCTPLLGTRSGSVAGSTGSWLFPLWDLEWNHRPDDSDFGYDHRFLLLGGASGGRRFDDRSSVWFWPLFSDETNPKVDALRAEMDAPRAPEREFFRYDSVQDVTWVPGDADSHVVTDRECIVRPVRESSDEGTHFLLGLGGSSHRVSINNDVWKLARELGGGPDVGPLARFADHNDGVSFRWIPEKRFHQTVFGPLATNTVARYVAEDSDWFFPLWSHNRTRGVMFELPSGEKSLDAELETFSALLFLYDYRRETVPEEGHDYARRRVLWRLYHYERLNGDESTDVFPAITWDRRKDGYRKFSFLWRLFRYERDPEKGTSLDLFFLPLRRP